MGFFDKLLKKTPNEKQPCKTCGFNVNFINGLRENCEGDIICGNCASIYEINPAKIVLNEYITKGFKGLPLTEAFNKYSMIYRFKMNQQWMGTYKKGSIPDKFDDDFIQFINNLSKTEQNHRQLILLTSGPYRRVYDGIQTAVDKKLDEYKTPQEQHATEVRLKLIEFHNQLDKLSENEFEIKIREILNKYNSIVDEKNPDSILSILHSPIYHLKNQFLKVLCKIVTEGGTDNRIKKNIVKPLISSLNSTDTEIDGTTKGKVAQILGKIKGNDAIDSLINQLNNSHYLDTEKGCIRALGDLQDKRGLTALKEFKNTHNYMHNEIDSAIKKIQEKI